MVQNSWVSAHRRRNVPSRLIPLEIDSILTSHRDAATSGPNPEAEARALERLDRVAIKIDPEDHALEALLDAARSQIESHPV